MHRIGVGQRHSRDRMAEFMMRDDLALVPAEEPVAFLQPRHQPLQRRFEVLQPHRRFVIPRRQQRRQTQLHSQQC